MSRMCAVCRYKNLRAVDTALAFGEAIQSISRRTQLKTGALYRHKKIHLPHTLLAAKDSQEIADSKYQFKLLEKQLKDLERYKKKSEDKNQIRDANFAVREIVRIVALLSELNGQLDRRPQFNLLFAPEWVALRTKLLNSLQPYPDARLAVANAMEPPADAPYTIDLLTGQTNDRSGT